MIGLLPPLVGFLFAVGLWLLLDRSLVRMVLGLIFLGYASTLLLFAVGGTVRGLLPLVPPGLSAPPPGAPDPVPQALVLTAIVIGFGTVAFASVLVSRVLATGDEDTDGAGDESERMDGEE